MTIINFLWPTWARVVAHVPVRECRSWKTVQRAAALLANRYAREQDARGYRLLRDTFRGRAVLLALALGLSGIPATEAASSLQERDTPRAEHSEHSGDEDEAPPAGAFYRGLGWAAWGSTAGDFASTEYAIAHGGSEGNPLMKHRGVRIGGLVAAPILINETTETIRKGGQPKLALWMRIGFVALRGYVIVHNLRKAR